MALSNVEVWRRLSIYIEMNGGHIGVCGPAGNSGAGVTLTFATNQKMLLYSGVSFSCICLYVYFLGRGIWIGPGLGDWIRGLSYDQDEAAVEVEAGATGRALALTTAAPRSRNAVRIKRGGAGMNESQRMSPN